MMRNSAAANRWEACGQIVWVILIVFASASCTTGGPAAEDSTQAVHRYVESSPAWIWSTLPSNDSVVFAAAGTRHSKREQEKISALKDAARQAGVFAKFWGASQSLVKGSGGSTAFRGRTRAYYDGPAADAALGKLKAEDSWVTDEGTWVKFRLDGTALPALNWQPGFVGGQPVWKNKPPKIPGWITAVGLGKSQSTLAKSLTSADAAALEEMMSQVYGGSKTVRFTKIRSSETSADFGTASMSYGSGFGELRGFVVIARWYDQSGAWALAACPEDWNKFDG